jgi:hypothetical protein
MAGSVWSRLILLVVSTGGGTFSDSTPVRGAGERSGGRQAASGARSEPVVVVGAGTVRERLQLTPHQLGELTRRLGLDVGDRPNYPRYGSAEVHLLVAVQALREVLVPVEDACLAVSTFRESYVGGRGWIVLYPMPGGWVSVAAVAEEALASLLTLTGRAVVVDLAAIRHRSSTAWLRLLDAPSAD